MKEQICAYCGLKRCHQTSLCPKQFPAKPETVSSEVVQISNDDNQSIARQEPPKSEETVSTSNLLAVTQKVIMQTAIAKVENPETHEVLYVRVMLDSGSQRSYMTTKLMKDLKLNAVSKQQHPVRSFASKKPKKIKTP